MNWESINEKYYNEAFKSYSDANLSLDLSHLYLPFLKHIPNGGKILDAGCGPGRDAKHFLNLGYNVDAFDLSDEMVKFASKYTGISVQKKSYTEIEAIDVYDGIWCCASLLHIPSKRMKQVFINLIKSLKENGIIFASFKLGIFEGLRNGRYFNDMNLEKLSRLIPESAKVITTWETQDVRKHRTNEKWLNTIIKKQGM